PANRIPARRARARGVRARGRASPGRSSRPCRGSPRCAPCENYTHRRKICRMLSSPKLANQVQEPNLEVLSKCEVESAAEDEGGCEVGEGEEEFGSSFPAGVEAAVVVQPGVGAFDRPALVGLWVAGAALAGSAFLDDLGCDSALVE